MGFFGAIVLVTIGLLAFGWAYDRRQAKTYPTEE
jgi:hypothetical protein